MSTVVKPDIRVLPSPNFPAAAAEQLTAYISEAVATRGRCRLALAGGSTPYPVYQHLARPPLTGRIDWNAVHLFWSDERCMPKRDETSNYHMAKEALIDLINIPPANIHRIETGLPPTQAAMRYAELLGDEPLDVALLGMGDDGHTASLFPAMLDLGQSGPRVIATEGPAAPRQRVTLTLRALNESRMIIFLMTGASKAGRLREVQQQIMHGESGPDTLPSAQVQPASGRLIWLVDKEAAANLDLTSTQGDNKNA